MYRHKMRSGDLPAYLFHATKAFCLISILKNSFLKILLVCVTDGRTDTPSCRDTRTDLKKYKKERKRAKMWLCPHFEGIKTFCSDSCRTETTFPPLSLFQFIHLNEFHCRYPFDYDLSHSIANSDLIGRVAKVEENHPTVSKVISITDASISETYLV